MVLGSWQLNTVVTVLFLSTSLALVQRCDKDRFCEPGYDRSLLLEREDLIDRRPGWNAKRQSNLLDERWEGNWRRTGREDVSRDRLLRAEWHSVSGSVAEPGLLGDGTGIERLYDRMSTDEGRRERRENQIARRDDIRSLAVGERERVEPLERRKELYLEIQRRERVDREVAGIFTRRDRTIREKASMRLDDRREDERRERVDREDIIPERRERFNREQVERRGKERLSDLARQRERRSSDKSEDSTEREYRMRVSREHAKDSQEHREIQRREGVDREEIIHERRERLNREQAERRGKERLSDLAKQIERRSSDKSEDSTEREEAATPSVNSIEREDRIWVSRERAEESREQRETQRRERIDREERIPERRERLNREQVERRGKERLSALARQRGFERTEDRREKASDQQIERSHETVRANRLDRPSNQRREDFYRSENQGDRREGSGDTDRLIEQTEHADQKDLRAQIARENRKRFEEATDRQIERRSEVVRVIRKERAFERISNQRHEDFARSDSRAQNARENRERFEEAADRQIERRSEVVRVNRQQRSFDRILNQRREDFARSEDRREIVQGDRREGSQETDRLIEQTERADRKDSRAQIARENRERFEGATDRQIEGSSEAVRANRQERGLDRLSNQRHEDFARSDSRAQIARENRERFEEATDRKIERRSEVVRVNHQERALDRISNQRREDFARSEDRQEIVQGDRREGSQETDRLIEQTERADRKDSRAQIARENRERFEGATDRQIEGSSEAVRANRQERGLNRLSNQRHEDFARSDSRAEIARENRKRFEDATDRQIERRTSSEAVRANRQERGLDRLSNQRREDFARSEDRREIVQGDRREGSEDTDRLIEQTERADRKDSRAQIARENGERFEVATNRQIEGSSEAVRANRQERALDRLSNQRHEDFARSDTRAQIAREEAADRQIERRSEVVRVNHQERDLDRISNQRRKDFARSDSRAQNARENRERFEEATDRQIERHSEVVRVNRQQRALDRISNQRREDFARSEDRQEIVQGDRREVSQETDRLIEQTERADRKDSRAQIARENRERFEGATDRQIEGSSEEVRANRQERALEQLSNQRREDFARSDSRVQIARENRERFEEATDRQIERRSEVERVNRQQRAFDRNLNQLHEDFAQSDSRAENARENRELFEEATDRQIERRSEVERVNRQERALDRISNQRREDFARSEDRREIVQGNRREGSQDTDRLIEQTERADRKDSRAQIARESRERFEVATDRRIAGRSEAVRVNRQERALERLSNQRREDFARSDDRRDSRLSARDEAVRADRRNESRDRDAKREERNEHVDRNELLRIISHEDRERFDDIANRGEKNSEERDLIREEWRRVSEYLRERSDILTDRRECALERVAGEERAVRVIRREVQRDSAKDELKNQRHVDFSRIDVANNRRQETRKEQSRERIDSMRQASRDVQDQSGYLPKRREGISRNSRSTVNEDRRDHASRESVFDSTERSDESFRNVVRADRREGSRHREDREGNRELNRRKNVNRERLASPIDERERRERTDAEATRTVNVEGMTHREERREQVSARGVNREHLSPSNIYEEQREDLKIHRESTEQREILSTERRLKGHDERRERFNRLNIRDERRVDSRCQIGQNERQNDQTDINQQDLRRESPNRMGRNDRSDIRQNAVRSIERREYQVDDSIDYAQTFAKYTKPSLLTMIQGTLLAIVVMKTLNFDNAKFGNGILFKAIKLTGITEC